MLATPEVTLRVPPALAIPVTVIGGFLGAGKTTLLNHILSENHGVRAAVLVNDFGAINIDAKLVVGVEGETINLANGCICCNIRDDLVAACMGLLQRPERPERLIVETSGVSNPVEIANTFLLPELQPILALDSILCVVDCEQFPTLSGEPAGLARVQIAAADIVVLNKTDLVDRGCVAAVKSLIREISPGSRILEASHGRVPLAVVLGTGVTARRFPIRSDHHHHHGFAACHWTCDSPLSLPKLRAEFERLPDSVYRAKGVVYLEELPGYRVVLQMVGRRSNLRDAGRWGPERPRTEIIMIGIEDGIDGDAMLRILEGCIYDADEAMSPMLQLGRAIGRDGPRHTNRTTALWTA